MKVEINVGDKLGTYDELHVKFVVGGERLQCWRASLRSSSWAHGRRFSRHGGTLALRVGAYDRLYEGTTDGTAVGEKLGIYNGLCEGHAVGDKVQHIRWVAC